MELVTDGIVRVVPEGVGVRHPAFHVEAERHRVALGCGHHAGARGHIQHPVIRAGFDCRREARAGRVA